MDGLIADANAAPVALADDLLTGAAAIGAFLGWPARRVYHVAEKGQLPIWREAGVGLVARRSTLLEYVARREREASSSRIGLPPAARDR